MLSSQTRAILVDTGHSHKELSIPHTNHLQQQQPKPLCIVGGSKTSAKKRRRKNN